MTKHISAYKFQHEESLTRQRILELAETVPVFISNDGKGRYTSRVPVDNREYFENAFPSLKQMVVNEWSNATRRFENEPNERWNAFICDRFPDVINGKIAYKLLGANCPKEIQKNLNNDYTLHDIISMMPGKRMINLLHLHESWLVNRETIWSYLSKQPSIAVELYFERIFKDDLYFDEGSLLQLKGKKAVTSDPSSPKNTKRGRSSQKKSPASGAPQDKKPTISSEGKPVKVNKDEYPRRWLTTEEAAKYIGCSKNFLDKDRITRVHDIPFSKLGRRIVYDIFELDKYLEKTRVGTKK